MLWKGSFFIFLALLYDMNQDDAKFQDMYLQKYSKLFYKLGKEIYDF